MASNSSLDISMAVAPQNKELEINIVHRYTAEEVLELLFPVGSIYISTSGTAPTFGGTWQEVIVKQTLEQFKTGNREYFAGENSGNIHHWKRLA